MRRIARRILAAALFAGLAASCSEVFARTSKPAVCPQTSAPALVIQLPPVGELKVKNYDVPTHRGVAVLCDSQGHLLRKMETPEGMPGSIKAHKYDVPGWPSPVLVLVSIRPRGDGITLDAVLLTVSGGQLKELPELHLDAADALCLGTASDSHPAVDILESVTGLQCFMCWPKRFQLTTYSWNGSDLIRQSRRTTRNKHKDWRSALRELKMSCPAEVLQGTADPQE
ncbi:MAG TPA: hypothetical protein VLX28_05445 [Thermoanaerobaculia bacterium]|nr:hypothetical protein [Thermoanaerobaculia bacterium]